MGDDARDPGTGTIVLQRVHDAVRAPLTRPTFLVDRLWPRGIRKDQLADVTRLPDVAPSTTLRRWYGHQVARWPEFRRRYLAELDAHPGAADPIRAALRTGPVTLLYSARDTEHNQAVVLRDWLSRTGPDRTR